MTTSPFFLLLTEGLTGPACGRTCGQEHLTDHTDNSSHVLLNLSGKDAAAKEWREGRNEWHNTHGIIFLYKSKIIIGIILHRGDVTCRGVIGLSYNVWGVLLFRCKQI